MQCRTQNALRKAWARGQHEGSCGAPGAAPLPLLSLTPTRASSIRSAATQTRSGKTAVAANTPRVPHVSTSEPLK